ncbi:hypothetical protein ES703_122139 [subsurface metagenome]
MRPIAGELPEGECKRNAKEIKLEVGGRCSRALD